MTRRTERVAEAIRRLTSEVIHTELRDPRVAVLITITRVEVAPDLRFARIYYSVLGDEKEKKLVSRGLKSAKNFIRRHIANELKLRYATEIAFEIDATEEYKEKIDKILDKIHKERPHEKNKGNSEGDRKIQ
jgi:ribosome-binding factor A